jgi:hypothetical protein
MTPVVVHDDVFQLKHEMSLNHLNPNISNKGLSRVLEIACQLERDINTMAPDMPRKISPQRSRAFLRRPLFSPFEYVSFPSLHMLLE